jgi:hypothetical protein
VTVALVAPVVSADAVELAKHRFRKQVLKEGTVDYKGRKLVFDAAYCQDLVDSFNAGAYDQVSFVLCDGDNRHNLDPERWRGEVKALLAVPGDGVDMVLETGDKGAELVTDNPRLGVSVGIVENADGKFKRAIQHVAATLDPHVTGMRPWQPVELSAPALSVVDLSQATYEREALVPELTEDELALFRAMLADKKAAEEAAKAPTPPAVAAVPVRPPVSPPSPAADGSLNPEIEAMLAAIEADTGQRPEPVAATLSAETRNAINMAQANEDARAAEIAAIRLELSQTRWDKERGDLISVGVPPAVVDLAAAGLNDSAAQLITLSNASKPEDIGALKAHYQGVIRGLLAEHPRIDLSAEHGVRTIGSTTAPDERASAKNMAELYLKQFGGRK